MQGNSLLILKDRYRSGIVITTTSSSQLVVKLPFFQVCQHHHNQHQCLRCLLWKWIKKWTKDMQDSLKVNTNFSSRFIKKNNEFGSLNKKERCSKKGTKLSMKLQSVVHTLGDSVKSSKIHTSTHSQKKRSKPQSNQRTSQLRSLLKLNQKPSQLSHQRTKVHRKLQRQRSPIITATIRITEQVDANTTTSKFHL